MNTSRYIANSVRKLLATLCSGSWRTSAICGCGSRTQLGVFDNPKFAMFFYNRCEPS